MIRWLYRPRAGDLFHRRVPGQPDRAMSIVAVLPASEYWERTMIHCRVRRIGERDEDVMVSKGDFRDFIHANKYKFLRRTQ